MIGQFFWVAYQGFVGRQKMNMILTKLTRNSWHEIKQRTLVVVMVAELVDQTVNPHLQ